MSDVGFVSEEARGRSDNHPKEVPSHAGFAAVRSVRQAVRMLKRMQVEGWKFVVTQTP